MAFDQSPPKLLLISPKHTTCSLYRAQELCSLTTPTRCPSVVIAVVPIWSAHHFMINTAFPFPTSLPYHAPRPTTLFEPFPS